MLTFARYQSYLQKRIFFIHHKTLAVRSPTIYVSLMSKVKPSPSFNEAFELSRRYVHFNIQGLFDTAVNVVGHGAHTM